MFADPTRSLRFSRSYRLKRREVIPCARLAWLCSTPPSCRSLTRQRRQPGRRPLRPARVADEVPVRGQISELVISPASSFAGWERARGPQAGQVPGGTMESPGPFEAAGSGGAAAARSGGAGRGGRSRLSQRRAKPAPCAGLPHPLDFPLLGLPGERSISSRRSSAVEQLIRNQQVASSILAVGSTLNAYKSITSPVYKCRRWELISMLRKPCVSFQTRRISLVSHTFRLTVAVKTTPR